MTPYVGCEYARERLEGLLDDELSVDEQVLVESHVRWCRTCADRIEDFQLIGTSIRVGHPGVSRTAHVEPALSAVYSRVLMRVRVERDQAFSVRLRELFTDMHLLWPALGATMAVLVCLSVAIGVLKSTTIERPESLAMRLEAMSPGSEANPLRPDNNARVDRYFDKYVDSDRAGGISIPRVLDDGAFVAGIRDQEATFTMATVVNREGRITNAELLNSERSGAKAAKRPAHANDVLDAVRQSRFAPAQTPIGRTVAVNMVWLIVVTTVQQTPDPQVAPPSPVVARTRRLPQTDVVTPLPVGGRQSSRLIASPTA
jgi:hypothetical protein